MMKKKNLSIRSGLFGALLAALAACYMPLFMYFSNAAEAAFADILPLLGIFAVSALGLFALLLLIMRSPWKSALTAALGAIIATNYVYIEKVFFLLPGHLRYWHVVALVIFLYANLVFVFARKLKEDHAQTAGQVLLLVLAALTVVNLIGAIPTIAEKGTVALKNREAEHDTVEQTAVEAKLPNIYYFIFDEFSSKATIEKCYGYSNDDLFQELENLGFTVSYDSHNISHSTITVTTNYINLDYVVVDDDSPALKNALKSDNATKELMLQYGYDLRFLGAASSVGDWGIADNIIEAAKNQATTVSGTTLADVILEKTIVYFFRNTDQQNNWLSDRINDVFAFYTKPESYDLPQHTYTLTYVCCPHEPFIFNADGTPVNPKNYRNWTDPQYYLNQYIYISGKIKETFQNIISNDPSAIIIAQSDHSARWAPSVNSYDMSSILNAVYYGGEALNEIHGKSGVNTLRTVYSKLFDIDLADVEVVE